MFEKNLQDLVKGIRAHRRDTGDFISQAIQEIKQELKSVDPFVKAEAVRKLTYLQMLGYDISWAAFSVIEVMTSPRFNHKRIGYLAANQTFTEETEVILLATNHLKKEFASSDQYDIGLAINCLANIATPDLSRDLLGDASSLLSHAKPYVRKKALLVMYKVFMKYPQGLRLCFDRIREKLDDQDNGVVSCAVNIICELADKNPRNYLSLAPRFFKLLTTTSNNWMLIKVVKLLGSLVPEEPRLARKLLEPLATIIQNTQAKSLLYECVHTVTLALPFTKKDDGTESRAVPIVVKLCTDHLKQFIMDPDQNLKYLGLVGFVNLMASHPKSVLENREIVLGCLTDNDVTIRCRALELLAGMVTKRTLEGLVSKLLWHVQTSEGSYREDLLLKIMSMCSKDKYSFLTDFQWYSSVLVELCHLDYGSKLSTASIALANQLIDVTLRVEAVRPYLTNQMRLFLVDRFNLLNSNINLAEILSAAAYVVGEYIESIDCNESAQNLISVLLSKEAAELLPNLTKAMFINSAMKIFIAACQTEQTNGTSDRQLGEIITIVDENLATFERSFDFEVQGRACLFRGLMISYNIIKEKSNFSKNEIYSPELPKGDDKVKVVRKDDTFDLLNMDNGGRSFSGEVEVIPADEDSVAAARRAATELLALKAEVMKPVNPKAQSKVPPPDDVDLEKSLNPSAWNNFSEENEEMFSFFDPLKISFTQLQVPNIGTDTGYDSYLDAPPSEDFELNRRLGNVSEYKDTTEITPKGQKKKKTPTQDPFYLGSNVNPSEVDVSKIPIGRLTAKDFGSSAKGEEVSSKKHKKKGKKRSSKGKEGGDLNEKETVVVALSSDEENIIRNSNRNMSRFLSKKERNASKEDVHGLGAIDITTPLGEDEKIPEQKHRIVVASKPMQVDGTVKDENDEGAVEDEKNKKKVKKVRSKSKKADGEASTKPMTAKTADLLDLLDFGSEAVESQMNEEELMELSQVFMNDSSSKTNEKMEAGKNGTANKKSKEKKKSKKSKRRSEENKSEEYLLL